MVTDGPMSDGRVHLALFDIDGTLVRGGSIVRTLFEESLLDVFGRAGALNSYDFSGKTDPQIVTELMRGAGLAETEIEQKLPSFRDVYLERLEERLQNDDLQLLPQVNELLAELRAIGVALGLVTGNWEGGARIKLSRVDLNRYFEFGAFGDGHPDRMTLPPVALDNAEASTGRRYEPGETVIIGDTPLDVECAHRHGIRSIAVATGWKSTTELEAAGATWVLEDLAAAYEIEPLFAPRQSTEL